MENVYDLVWAKTPDGNTVSYGDVYHQNEVEQSTYNFEYSDADWLLRQFNDYEAQAKRLFAEENADLALPAYELVLKAGHTFNLFRRTRRDFRNRAGNLYWTYSCIEPRRGAKIYRKP